MDRTGMAGRDLTPGVTLRLADGLDWTIPPLTIDRLVHHLPALAEISGMNTSTPWHAVGAQTIGSLIAMVADAMRRNYPKLTDGQVAVLLDIRTFGDAIAAALNKPPLKTDSTAALPQFRVVEKADG